MRRIIKRGLLATVGVAVLTATLVTPAQAENEFVFVGEGAALNACAAAADAANYEAWTCLGGTLYVTLDENGDPSDETIVVVEDIPSEEARGLTPRFQLASAVTRFGGGPVFQKGGDSWDTWCETSATCSTKVNAYYAKNKYNVGYGNQSGGVGSYDVIIETRLNGGRQAQWTLILNWDSGPAVTFYDPTIQCRFYVFLAPSGACGSYGTTADPKIASVGYRWSMTVYRYFTAGVSHDYYGEHRPKFRPSVINAPILYAPTMTTRSFYCPTSGACTFR